MKYFNLKEHCNFRLYSNLKTPKKFIYDTPKGEGELFKETILDPVKYSILVRNAERGRFPQTGKASTFRANDVLG